MSLKQTFLLFGVLALCRGSDDSVQARRHHNYEDPFAALDRHVSHVLSHHYMWPWSQLMKAAAALDEEESLEEPQIVTDPNKYQVNLNVKRFDPDELRIKVKNRYIIVEGKHKESKDEHLHFIANHFMQRFVLPAACKPEEVTALLKSNGVLSISAPKHELPPPPPEREVPIIVEKPVIVDLTTEKAVEESKPPEEVTEKKIEEQPTSSSTPAEQLDLVEATTHLGKIRKKELKSTTKTTKDNEVTKGIESNGLDNAYYVLE